MFKKFIVGKIVDVIWNSNKFEIVYDKEKNRLNFGFDINEKDFEILKNKLISKITSEIKVL